MKNNILAIGGDKRQEYMCRRLKEHGYDVVYTDSLDTDVVKSKTVILPLPVTKDGIKIYSTDIPINDFFMSVGENQMVFLGKKELIKNLNFYNKNNLYDYEKNEIFLKINAKLTSYGVLKYILNNTDQAPDSLKIAVTGYGNCGKSLCALLSNNGCIVNSFSRRDIKVKESVSNGINGYLMNEIYNRAGDYDVIINTVPEVILDESLCQKLKDEVMLIDIASAPYGFDIKKFECSGFKVNILPSLPGKCFPKSAGYLIADTVSDIIKTKT